MERGDVAGALNEVSAAAGKRFNDYTRESIVGIEEALVSAGHDPVEATALGLAELRLPHLAPLKKLASQMADLAVRYGENGDSTSQQALLEAAWQAGTQLREYGRDGALLTDLVGVAMQNMSLQRWPADTSAPFLDRPAPEVLAENQEFRRQIRENAPLIGEWLPNAPEDELTAYYDRIRTLGERNAAEWLKNRRPDLLEQVRQRHAVN
jgi:hypothetical protein